MTSSFPSVRGLVLLLLLGALWGSSYVLIGVAVLELPAQWVAFLRQVLAALVLLPLLVPAVARGVFASRWRHLFLLSLVMGGAPSLFVALGQQLGVPPALAAVLVSTVPLMTALLARRFDVSQVSSPLQVAGLLLALSGVTLLFGLDLTSSLATAAGGVLLLLASLCYAAGGFLARSWFGGVSPLALAGGTSLLSALILVPPAALSAEGALPVSLSALAAVALLGLGGTAGGWFLYYSLIGSEGPRVASVATFLAPAFALLFSVVLLAQPITPVQGVGFVLVLAGSVLAVFSRTPGGRPGLAGPVAISSRTQ